VLLGHERQTHAIDRGTNHELHVIDDQRAVHGNGEGLFALVELPPVDTGGSVSKVDASVISAVVLLVTTASRMSVRRQRSRSTR
jgi:hypothetical protein